MATKSVMLSLLAVLTWLPSLASASSWDLSSLSYMPPQGVVPDAQTAVLIGRPVLAKVYGAAKIRSEEPLTASQPEPGVWLVEGTFNHPGTFGGVAMVAIRQRDGAVLGMIHER